MSLFLLVVILVSFLIEVKGQPYSYSISHRILKGIIGTLVSLYDDSKGLN